jgi:hypothetical protein
MIPLLVAVSGLVCVVAGVALYDWRAGLILFGAVLVAAGLLVDFEGE